MLRQRRKNKNADFSRPQKRIIIGVADSLKRKKVVTRLVSYIGENFRCWIFQRFAALQACHTIDQMPPNLKGDDSINKQNFIDLQFLLIDLLSFQFNFKSWFT